jgi:protocatechuate 3,4-dioxygenase beta subunit
MSKKAEQNLLIPRRKFLTLAAAGIGVGGSAWAMNFSQAMTTPGRFAEELTKTPHMTEGPFYPDKLPLDTDNDLLVLNDSSRQPLVKLFILADAF